MRGFALFGVLLVNLLYFFRVSLFEHMLVFHSSAGWANHTVDLLAAEFLEFKAFGLFSLIFGVGIAIQAERAQRRGAGIAIFLVRRFLILLIFGICHLVFVSNVDILTLYAICGLLIIPLLRLPAAMLAPAGLAAAYLPPFFPRGPMFPSEAVLHLQAVNAERIYGHGTFGAMLIFRWEETRDLISPLLIGSAQRTFGLMLLGVALWRSGVAPEPRPYRRALWAFCLGAGFIGLINTAAHVLSRSLGRPVRFAPALGIFGSDLPLVLAYGAGLLAWRRSARAEVWTAPVAAAGRMALTNYLAQSLIFAALFYGYGFGLFGKLDTVSAAALGVAVYAAQLWFSVWWLRRCCFGPFEWVWRSMTYGWRQPMRVVRSTLAVEAHS
jgi:uncharacterized protein